jgi:hypothetical protein
MIMISFHYPISLEELFDEAKSASNNPETVGYGIILWETLRKNWKTSDQKVIAVNFPYNKLKAFRKKDIKCICRYVGIYHHTAFRVWTPGKDTELKDVPGIIKAGCRSLWGVGVIH